MSTQKAVLTSFVSVIALATCTIPAARASLKDVGAPLLSESNALNQSVPLAPQTLEELSEMVATNKSFKSLDLRAMIRPDTLSEAMSLLLEHNKGKEIEEISLFALSRNWDILKKFFETTTELKKFHLTMGATFVFLPVGTSLDSVQELKLGYVPSKIGPDILYDGRLEPLFLAVHFRNMERLEIQDATQQYKDAVEKSAAGQAPMLYFTNLVDRFNHYCLREVSQNEYQKLTYCKIPSSFIPLTALETGGKFLEKLQAPALKSLVVVNMSGQETIVPQKPDRNWLETVLYKDFEAKAQ